MKTVYREWMKNRLIHFRDQFKLTTADVARAIKMNPKTYGHYEEGVSMPSVLTLKQICKLYSITMDYFMEGSPISEASEFETPKA
jgi:transcriptional regulator with XRE-family HTH domain